MIFIYSKFLNIFNFEPKNKRFLIDFSTNIDINYKTFKCYIIVFYDENAYLKIKNELNFFNNYNVSDLKIMEDCDFIKYYELYLTPNTVLPRSSIEIKNYNANNQKAKKILFVANLPEISKTSEIDMSKNFHHIHIENNNIYVRQPVEYT